MGIRGVLHSNILCFARIGDHVFIKELKANFVTGPK